MPVLADAELNLAIACCRWSCFGGSADEIATHAHRVDWNRFLHVIQRHRVESLASSALSKNRIAPPPPFAEAISRHALANAELNLRAAAECGRLMRAFSDAGVDLLFVKGLSLSALAYGDPFLKTSTDIDLLVEQKAAGKTAEILAGLGYRLNLPAVGRDTSAFEKWHARRKESAWKQSGIDIDLHTALSDNPAMIAGIGMASPRQMVPITRNLSVPTLNTQDLFTYLCVHGTWSAWYRLKWLADLAALVARTGEVERLYRHATAQGAGRAPAQALLLANRLLGLDLPPSLGKELESQPVDRLISSVALHELRQFRPPNERPLGTVLLHLMRPLLLPGWRFKASEVKRQLRDVAQRVTMNR